MKVKSAAFAAVIIVIVMVITGGVLYYRGALFSNNPQNNDTQNTQQQEKSFETIAAETIQAIKKQDWDALSVLIDPEKGLRFSPYAYVDKEKDIVFKADKLKTAALGNEKYIWGSYDGTGDPIELTFADYYKKFIYDMDFANAKDIGYNKFIGNGNSLNNCLEAYPGASTVEYHFPGQDPKYEGMDWRSLRLVFEKSANQWYLVGIIHDQWTI